MGKIVLHKLLSPLIHSPPRECRFSLLSGLLGSTFDWFFSVAVLIFLRVVDVVPMRKENKTSREVCGSVH